MSRLTLAEHLSAVALFRAIPLADAGPLAILALYLGHRLRRIPQAVIAYRLGNGAIVTHHCGSGRSDSATARRAQDQEC